MGISEQVPDVRRIEEALEEIFTVRTTLRLLISNCVRPEVGEMKSCPSVILVEAYQHAQIACQREFKCFTPLLVNELPALQYLDHVSNLQEAYEVPYVNMHLYFVFFEVLTNAMRASVDKASPDGVLPPINVTTLETERMVKIADGGRGVPRDDARKVWSYFYSNRTTGVRGGLGLGMSRMLIRYF